MPMLFKRKEEMIADIFAIFLLIPLPIFLEEFERYLGEEGVPVSTSRWLEYLGNIAEVPYEKAAVGHQNMRYVSSFLCEKSCLDTLQNQAELHRRCCDKDKESFERRYGK